MKYLVWRDDLNYAQAVEYDGGPEVEAFAGRLKDAGIPYRVVDEDSEDLELGEALCPCSEPLHFHHDGCPSCAFA